MQAILLAGGLGTRLRSVVSDRPKPMALIQDKPFMEYVIQELKKQGIDEIIFAVGYKGSMVEEYFGDGSRFGITASYAYEEELLGTAGAIKNAARFMTGEQVFVLNADTFYRIDYSRCVACMDCIDKCRQGAIRYTRRKTNKAEIQTAQPAVDKPDRRKFFTVSALLATSAALKA